MTRRSEDQARWTDNTHDYRQTVLLHVHQLVKLGYERLDRSVCRQAEEPDISGDLADAMEGALDDRSFPWMDWFAVHNEAPIADPKRKGKRRQRLDIRIDSAMTRPRTRFAFEAKRLGDDHGVPQYVGEDGLGRFVRGEYARDEDMAGMLAYVQSGKPRQWAERIGQTLHESPRYHSVLDQRNWRHASIVEGLEHTYCSTHRREKVGRPIEIYHTLLDFS